MFQFEKDIHEHPQCRRARQNPCGVEKDIPHHAGTPGNEGLVNFIRYGVERTDDGGGEECAQSSDVRAEESGVGEKSQNGENAEMGGFADEKRDGFDFCGLFCGGRER